MAALLACLAGCGGSPSDDAVAGGAVLVLQGVTLIDGSGSSPQAGQTLVLRGERIVAIGPDAQIQVPHGAEILDLPGRFVTPGFVDLHVHFPEDSSVHQAMLDRLVEFGVTTILNPGARPGAGVSLREQIRGGELRGPRLFTAGPIIDQQPTEEGLAGWSVEVTTVDEIRAAVESQSLAGADFVKLYRHLPPEMVAAAVAAADQRGISVIGHMGETTWKDAAEFGVEMLVHSGWGTPMNEIVNLADRDGATDPEWYRGYADAPAGERFAALVESLVRNEVTVVPTLSITQAAGLGRDASLLPQFRTELAPDAYVDDWWSEGWEEKHPQYDFESEEEKELVATLYFPAVLGIVRAFFESGVRLGVGTDVGNSWMTPGFVFHHELGLYQDAGIPPLAILTMATRNGAEALGVLHDVGTLEVGKRANLLVFTEDPSVDIRNSRSLEMVLLGGERAWPASPQ